MGEILDRWWEDACEQYVGKKLIAADQSTDDRGNDYVRYHFEDGGYVEHLLHFTPEENELYAAKERIKELEKSLEVYRGI